MTNDATENVYQVTPHYASPSIRLSEQAYLTLGNPPVLQGLQSYTLEAWVQLSTLEETQSVLAHLDVGETEGFHLYVQDGYPVAYYPSAPYVVQGQQRLTANTWHHLACTYDHDTGTLTLYLDGFEAGSGQFDPVSFSDETDVLIGSALISGSMKWYLQGMVGSVMIWDSCRSAEEVLNDTVRTTVSSALAEPDLLTFLDVPYLPTADHSGNNLKTLQYKNGVEYCLCVPAVMLQNGAYVNVGNADDLSFPGTDAYTIEGWVYPEGPAGTIVSRYQGESESEYEIRYTEDQRLAAFRNSDGHVIQTEAGAIEPGRYYHVAVTYEPPQTGDDETSEGVLSLYVNGNLHATEYFPSDVPGASSVDVLLGARHDANGTPSNFFQGAIQNIRFWNTALSSSEIGQWMSNQPVDGKNLVASFDFGVTPPHDTTGNHDIQLEGGADVDYSMPTFAPSDVLARFGRIQTLNAVYFNQTRDPLNPTPPGPSAEELDARQPDVDELLSDAHKEQMWADIESLLEEGTELTAEMDEDEKDAWRSTLREQFEDGFAEARQRFEDNPDLMKVFSTVEERGLTRLIHHGVHGDEVILEYPTGAISDCTLWWIQFIFKLTVGFLQALGLAPSFGNIAGRIYNLVTANQRVMNALNSLIGKTISAATAIGVVGVLYNESLIWPIIKLALTTAGWWTLFWVLKQIIAVVTGLEAAAALAGFIVWAAQLTKLSLDYSTACVSEEQYDVDYGLALA